MLSPSSATNEDVVLAEVTDETVFIGVRTVRACPIDGMQEDTIAAGPGTMKLISLLLILTLVLDAGVTAGNYLAMLTVYPVAVILLLVIVYSV